jgi:hypothetical protein
MSEAELRGRSDRVRGRGNTGSMRTGGSSTDSSTEILISAVVVSVSGGGLRARCALSLSLLPPRNLLPFRAGLPETDVSGVLELPAVGSVVDLERSRVGCFGRNLESLEPWFGAEATSEGVWRVFLLDISSWGTGERP